VRHPERSARLLHAMHSVCSHDLPNRMVALRSLVHLIKMDGGDSLSPDLADMFDRLAGALDRTNHLVEFLKEMSRLNRCTPKDEPVRLASMAAEWRAELRGRLPQRDVDWQFHAAGDAFRTDRRLLHQAVVALLLLGSELMPHSRISTQVRGTVHEGRVYLTVRVHGSEPLLSPAPMVENRVEYALAAETLGVLGGTLECTAEPQGVAFALTIPSSPHHG
jgi:signal transduction histidine kinase